MLLCEGCAAPLSSCWSKRIHLHTPPLRGKAMVFVFNAQFIVILLFAQSSRKDSREREREMNQSIRIWFVSLCLYLMMHTVVTQDSK